MKKVSSIISVSILLIVSIGNANAICEDISGPFDVIINGKTKSKDCEWVGQKSKSRCKKVGVLIKCPETCGECGNCDEYLEPFDLFLRSKSSVVSVTCADGLYPEGDYKIEYCEKYKFFGKCPKTCGACDDPLPVSKCSDVTGTFKTNFEPDFNCADARKENGKPDWEKCKKKRIKRKCGATCGC
jgi:hypothetical protein